jgi:hypothetical protein
MRLTILTALALSTLAACAAQQPPVQTASADPNCMTREQMSQILVGQGLEATILDDRQNAAWHVYDQAHSQQPDPAGFTYVAGEGGTTTAVIVGFSPDGCAAYYTPVSQSALSEALGS